MSKITKALEKAKNERNQQKIVFEDGSILDGNSEILRPSEASPARQASDKKIRIRKKKSKKTTLFSRKTIFLMSFGAISLFFLGYIFFYDFSNKDHPLLDQMEIQKKQMEVKVTTENKPVKTARQIKIVSSLVESNDEMKGTIRPTGVVDFLTKDPGQVLVVDFDSGERQNAFGGYFSTFSPPDLPQEYACNDYFNTRNARLGEGLALRLDYNVGYPNEIIQSGFKMDLAGYPLEGIESVHFFIKGDLEKGFTEDAVFEITGDKTRANFSIKQISVNWEEVAIPLAKFKKTNHILKELRIVFQTDRVSRSKGTVYLDDIFFKKVPPAVPTE